MTRIVGQALRVREQDGEPVMFVFRGEHVVEEILDRWKEAGSWWSQDSAPDVCREVEVVRVLTADGGVYELEHAVGSREWRMYRVWD